MVTPAVAFFEKHLRLSRAGQTQTCEQRSNPAEAANEGLADRWQKAFSAKEVILSSAALVLLGAGLVALFAHYPYYPCCFHQLSADIRHWNFQGLDPLQPKEFWGYSYLSALVAAVTQIPNLYTIAQVVGHCER
jgi:hypothetical protein